MNKITLIVCGIISGSIIILTIVGNALVIIVIRRYRRLRHTTNMVLGSLAAADLTLGLIVMPPAFLTDLFPQYHLINRMFCYLWISFDIMCCTASIFHLCIVAVDKYIAITRPLLYHRIMTHRHTLYIIFIIWILSAIIAVLPLAIDKRKTKTLHITDHQTTDHESQGENNISCAVEMSGIYAIVSSCISFHFPLVVMSVLYARILCIAVQQHRRLIEKLHASTYIYTGVQSTTIDNNRKNPKIHLEPSTTHMVKSSPSILSNSDQYPNNKNGNSDQYESESFDNHMTNYHQTRTAKSLPTLNVNSIKLDRLPHSQTQNRINNNLSRTSAIRLYQCRHLPAPCCTSYLLVCDVCGNELQKITVSRRSTLNNSNQMMKDFMKMNDSKNRQYRHRKNKSVCSNHLQTKFQQHHGKNLHLYCNHNRKNLFENTSLSAKENQRNIVVIPDDYDSSLQYQTSDNKPTDDEENERDSFAFEQITDNHCEKNESKSPSNISEKKDVQIIRKHNRSLLFSCSFCYLTRREHNRLKLTNNNNERRHNRNIWRHEAKALKTLGSIMSVFVIMWLPFFLLHPIKAMRPELFSDNRQIWRVIERLFTWIGYCNSCMNPIIYAFLNKDFKRAFISTLTCDRSRFNKYFI
ncbi:hypothetical protein SNEBB_010128 [Seison nebaliae]|nr:hypothetical protein SNEBB_010128 [Seison nebaliae]